MPAYNLSDFMQCCADQAVFVWDPALKTASENFGIHGQDKLQAFISEGGLENLAFVVSEPFRNWKVKPPAPIVDSYTFTTGNKDGYIAFFRNPDVGIFNLKSFKPNEDAKPHNFVFKELFKTRQIRQVPEKEEGHEEKNG